MNKYLPLVVIVTSSLILGGCTTKKSATSQTTPETMQESNKFAQALESGAPTICTVTKDADKMEYHIKNKMMRLDSKTTFTSESGQSTTTLGHMINDGKYVYSWDETTKQGVKMAVPTEEEAAQISDQVEKDSAEKPSLPDQDTLPNSAILKNEGYSISCNPGAVDDSLFTPPTDITFVDPKSLMMTIPSSNPESLLDEKKMEELSKQFGQKTPTDQ